MTYCPICKEELVDPDPPGEGAYHKFAYPKKCSNGHYFMVFNVAGVLSIRTASQREIDWKEGD